MLRQLEELDVVLQQMMGVACQILVRVCLFTVDSGRYGAVLLTVCQGIQHSEFAIFLRFVGKFNSIPDVIQVLGELVTVLPFYDGKSVINISTPE